MKEDGLNTEDNGVSELSTRSGGYVEFDTDPP